MNSLSAGGLQTGPLLQPRREAGRDRQQQRRRAAGQRHAHASRGHRAGMGSQAATAGTSRTTAGWARSTARAVLATCAVHANLALDQRRRVVPTEITPWGTTASRVYLARSPPILPPPASFTRAATRTSGRATMAATTGANSLRSPVRATWTSQGQRQQRGTVGGRVFVTTNALAATVGPPTGVVFTDITRNFPADVGGVAFDPNDPSDDLRRARRLQRRSPANRTRLPNDAGRDGMDRHLAGPRRAVQRDRARRHRNTHGALRRHRLRRAAIHRRRRVVGDARRHSFSARPGVRSPLPPASCVRRPTGAACSRSWRPPARRSRSTSSTTSNSATVCEGPQFLTLEIFNVGGADLVITSVQRLMGSTSFSVLATPGTPLVIAPGEHVDFTVRYNPTGAHRRSRPRRSAS